MVDQYCEFVECFQCVGECVECGGGGCVECGLQQQVFGWIVGQCEFGGDYQLCIIVVCGVCGCDDLCDVVGEIVDGDVDLGESELGFYGGSGVIWWCVLNG